MALMQEHNLPFRVFETLRTHTRQLQLVNKGASRTLKSKHIEGKAIDLVLFINGKWSWDEKHLYYYEFLGALVEAKIGHKVLWGKHWPGFKDYVHFQLKEDTNGKA